MPEEPPKDERVVIKKYANRRLYNTESSSYVTLDHLAALVREGRDFVVKDAKTGEDITRSVLTQIIFEQENKGGTLLPIPFLRQLIGFYGDQMSAMLPGYLQSAMDAFTQNQERMRRLFESSLDPEQAMSLFDEMTRRNMEMAERTMKMLTPFAAGKKAAKAASSSDDKIEALERRLAEMQRQLSELRRK